jgi:hypothetical protein
MASEFDRTLEGHLVADFTDLSPNYTDKIRLISSLIATDSEAYVIVMYQIFA